jgi:hypothetical protein
VLSEDLPSEVPAALGLAGFEDGASPDPDVLFRESFR